MRRVCVPGRGAHEAEAQDAVQVTTVGLEARDGPVGGGRRRAGVGEEPPAGLGGDDGVGAAVEEVDADLALQQLEDIENPRQRCTRTAPPARSSSPVGRV